ncbi:MAG: PAS domain-containing protein [Ramlibacter sp.]
MNEPRHTGLEFLQGGGEMGERIRGFDWASHPMGPPQQWPESLRMALSLCLDSSFPTAIYWGPAHYVLYNDAWSVIPADKHPAILGMPASEGWSDIWHVVGPQFEKVFRTGVGEASYGQMLPMRRHGRVTETWWNYSLSAIRDADNAVAGIFNQGNEITQVVHARREREAEIARWREVFRQAPAAVALLRGPDHVFEFANDAYLRLVGRSDILGQPVAQALPETVKQGFVQLLDSVLASGEPYLGNGAAVKLQRRPGAPPDDRVLDFIYQPLRDAGGNVDGVFVLVTDATDRARAEAALRLSNWQLGEERARLAALIEAEQRAQHALRRVNESLEWHVNQRTAQLSMALQKESEVMHRLRTTFETDLIFQGFLDADGILLDANPVSLAAIGCRLDDVRGRPFWETPWFTSTPGASEAALAAVHGAQRGETVHTVLTVDLPIGRRSYRFSMRPAMDGRGQLIGLVPEALELRESGPPAPA